MDEEESAWELANRIAQQMSSDADATPFQGKHTAQDRAKAKAEEGRAKEVETMRTQRATWQEDGLGIRGPVTRVSNARANLNWPDSVTFRRPELNVPDEAPPAVQSQ